MVLSVIIPINIQTGKNMNKYIKIMRIDHWMKQFFIIPGCVCAIFLTNPVVDSGTAVRFIIGFFATSSIASANYVINEWLDAEFDKYHPTKKSRSAVVEKLDGRIVWCQWGILVAVGCWLAGLLGKAFALTGISLGMMGIFYNVKPFRTKDIAILDVVSESVNNAIRLLLGWFIISSDYIPPCSAICGYWSGGAFLMAVKRYAEYRMIGDSDLAGKYRKSFCFYTEHSLLVSAFFYAMCAVFFIGIFLIKYRIELLLFVPALIGLFCFYFWLSFKEDSAVQKPERLYREKGLMLYCLLLVILLMLLLFLDIPFLNIFISEELIRL